MIPQGTSRIPQGTKRTPAGAPMAPIPEFPATIFDQFTATGATWPWYGDTHRSCMHFDDTNVTWYMWETSFGDTRYCFVMTSNETTGAWSDIYFCGSNTLVDDDHGNPSIQRDTGGYVYNFYGAHGFDPVQVARTTTPDTPSTWTDLTEVSGNWTYPCCDLVGSDFYLFMRGDETQGETDSQYVYKKAVNPQGTPSWGAQVKIINFGAGTRVYSGNHIVVGTDIYICFCFADDGNTYRQDVFCGIYNTLTGSFRNLSGSTTVAAGSLPINLATARSDFRIVDQLTDSLHGAVPQMCFDTLGRLHFSYVQGEAAGPFFMQHIMWNVSTLSTPIVVGEFPSNAIYHQTDRQTCVALDDGSVDLYWVTASQYNYDWGGNISRRTLSPHGELGIVTLIRPASSAFPLNAVTAVQNGSAKARVVFAETVTHAVWPATESGILKCYAFGDYGYSHAPVPAYNQGWTPWEFGSSLAYWVDLLSPGHLDMTVGNPMAWKEVVAGELFTQSTAAQRPAYSATGWDGTRPSLTGDGASTNGDALSSNTVPFMATQTVFIVSKRGTQGNSASSSLRPIFVTPLSAIGGALAQITVLRPGVDAGQSLVTASGQGAGSVSVDAPDPFVLDQKALLIGLLTDNNLRVAVDDGNDSSAGDVGATTKSSVSLFANAGVAAQAFAGQIVECYSVNRAVTTEERGNALAYATQKWGL
jgi:hypothetical protein